MYNLIVNLIVLLMNNNKNKLYKDLSHNKFQWKNVFMTIKFKILAKMLLKMIQLLMILHKKKRKNKNK